MSCVICQSDAGGHEVAKFLRQIEMQSRIHVANNHLNSVRVLLMCLIQGDMLKFKQRKALRSSKWFSLPTLRTDD